jgi:hypothetical protein
MTIAFSTAIRDARNNAITTAVGNAGLLAFYNGVRPASGGTATTKLLELTCGSPFAPASSGGVLTPTNPAAANAIADGTITWARLTTSGGTFCQDFSAGKAIVTTITGASGAAQITVGSATNIAIGQRVSGTGIATGARVVNINGTTITLDKNNTGAVSGNGTFSPDIVLVNDNVATGQPGSVTSWSHTEGNA